ncbi:MAG: hypothetical protein ACE5ES_00605 [Candidatus Nanoarchaeia archaeon]
MVEYSGLDDEVLEDRPSKIRRKVMKSVVTLGSLAIAGITVHLLDGALDNKYNVNTRFFDESSKITPYTMYGFNPLVEGDVESTAYFGFHEWPENPTVMLGGSTAAGKGVSVKGNSRFAYDLTYFRVASKESGLDIVTAGCPGYMSPQELIVLSSQIIPSKPENVVLFSGYNDIILSSELGLNPGEPIVLNGLRTFIDHPEYSTVSRSLESIGLKGFGKYFMIRKFNKDSPNDLEAVLEAEFEEERKMRDKRFRIWENSFRSMANLCNSSGINFIFLAQPNGFYVNSHFGGRYPWVEEREAHYGGEVWPAFIEFASNICEEEGVPFLDYTSSVHPKSFMDAVHFDNMGHEVVGKLLAEDLKNLPEVFSQPTSS